MFWCLFPVRVNPRRAGGGRFTSPHPEGLSRISKKKNGGAQRRRFWCTCSYIFFARVLKVSDPGHSRSGHQVTSSDPDLTSENVWMFVIATPNARSPWNFQWLITVPVSMKCLSRKFWYPWPKVRSILLSLHFKSMGEKWKAPLLEENHSKHFQTSG